ncbi:hypothetical protein RF11_14284 [Thelohanellus kitauei]|uniref:Uncharacterized protein n=1 Tax=Thelohanellus kitauei TaxID=669202 RepID=A0A0C2I9M5_THEKT|nr:hypothetical protein RF11_14284 [Thelohanellus kitauei]
MDPPSYPILKMTTDILEAVSFIHRSTDESCPPIRGMFSTLLDFSTMVIRDVLDNIGIVVEALDSASWRELIFKGIRGSVYRIGMRPTLWIPKRIVVVNGEKNRGFSVISTPQRTNDHSPNILYDIRSFPVVFHKFPVIRLFPIFDHLKVNEF